MGIFLHVYILFIIVMMDICIHLTQSICRAWYAKPPFVKDLEYMLDINTG